MGAIERRRELGDAEEPQAAPNRSEARASVSRWAIAQNAVTAARNMQAAAMSLVTRAPLASMVGQNAKSADREEAAPVAVEPPRPEEDEGPVATPKSAIIRRPALSIDARSLPQS